MNLSNQPAAPKLHPIEFIVSTIRGASFVAIDTETVVKLPGGKKNPFQGRLIKRIAGSTVMITQNKYTNAYENMVQRRLIDEGKDPTDFVLSPRTWGERIPETPFVTHKNQMYLEVIFLRVGKIQYFVDDVEAPPELLSAIEGLMDEVQKPEQGGLENKVVLRTFNFASIKAITIDGIKHPV